MAAVAMASYNNLSATAALPDIGDDLGRVELLPWVVTVELVAAAVSVLAVGPFIDGAGARRAFRLTVTAFLVTSTLCTVAPTMELLITARVLQGLATGGLIGTALTCIGLAFEEHLRGGAGENRTPVRWEAAGLATTIPESTACGCRHAGSCGPDRSSAGTFSGVSGLCRLSAVFPCCPPLLLVPGLQRSGPACPCGSR